MNLGLRLSNVDFMSFEFYDFLILIKSILNFKLFFKINHFFYTESCLI